MEITLATPHDIPQLCVLLELLFAQEADFQPDRARQELGLSQIIEAPDHGQIWVLREGDEVIGMINLLFTISTAVGGRVAILEDMVVHPARRGAGAGSLLLQGAINAARAEGCRRITLLTDRSNQAAQKFYQRHGFGASTMMTMRLPLD